MRLYEIAHQISVLLAQCSIVNRSEDGLEITCHKARRTVSVPMQTVRALTDPMTFEALRGITSKALIPEYVLYERCLEIARDRERLSGTNYTDKRYVFRMSSHPSRVVQQV